MKVSNSILAYRLVRLIASGNYLLRKGMDIGGVDSSIAKFEEKYRHLDVYTRREYVWKWIVGLYLIKLNEEFKEVVLN